MRRALIVTAVAVVLLAIASQLAIPPIAEHRIEGRLTDNGGSADVSVSAFPAAKLIFGDGDKLTVDGSGLNLDLQQNTDVFDKLDGFDEVNMTVDNSKVGPFQVSSFSLTRPAPDAAYHMVSHGTTTPGDLANFGASQVGLPGGPLFKFFSDATLGTHPVPFNLNVQMESDGGRITVTSGGVTIAGIPTGPLAELITAAIVVQI